MLPEIAGAIFMSVGWSLIGSVVAALLMTSLASLMLLLRRWWLLLVLVLVLVVEWRWLAQAYCVGPLEGLLQLMQGLLSSTFRG